MDCMQYTLCNMAYAQYGLSAIITTLIAQSHNSGTSSISPQSLKQTPIGHYRSHMHAHVYVLTTLNPCFQVHSIVTHFTYVLSLCAQ